jgi:hypothetical protein
MPPGSRYQEAEVPVRVARYLALVLVSTAMAIATVHQHVERTRLGYEARALEREIERLKETRRASLLEREHAAAPEKLVVRAREFQIANESELKALVAPVAPPRKGH